MVIFGMFLVIGMTRGWSLIDALMVMRMLLMMIVFSMAPQTQINYLNRVVVDKDVDIQHATAQLEDMVRKQIQINLSHLR